MHQNLLFSLYEKKANEDFARSPMSCSFRHTSVAMQTELLAPANQKRAGNSSQVAAVDFVTIYIFVQYTSKSE